MVGQRRASCEQIRRNARFSIYFDKVEIEKLVQTVSDATCRTFILPENVRGRISIVGPENGKVEVNADEFYRAFLAALDANGLAVYTQGDFSKIIDKRNAKQTPIPTISPDGSYTTAEQMVTKLFKVKYVEIEPLRAVLQQLVSQNGDTIPFAPDTLIINDLGSNMHRLERIIRQLDSRSSSEEMRIIQIQFASAQEIADKIQKLFPTQPTGPGGRRGQRGAGVPPPGPPPPPGCPPAATPTAGAEPQAAAGTDEAGGIVSVSQIIPDERTNKLIVIASPAGFQRIEELVRMLDVPIPGEGRINVYYLENADAEEISGTLQALASGSAGRARQAGGPPQPPTAPGAPRAPTQAAELFSGEVRISADKATNSLVIIASQSDYRNLIKVIQKLDMPRRQVFIEAVIMEVNVRRENKFGARLHSGLTVPTADGNLPVLFGTKFGDAERLPPSLSILNLAAFGGFLAGLQGPAIPGLRETLGIDIPAFGILLHALQESSDANVLSTPHILTSDNEEAEITVGQNVPFQAGASPSALAGLGSLGAGATPGGLGGINPAQLSGLFGGFVTPINRQNVELKLTVKPQINDSDFIRLAITEQTEEIAGTHPVLGPTTSKRSAKTTVVARDQETIVLGGIMQDRTIEGVSKVPILGDLPILGHLFREETREKVKLNLLLFLTPYIIKDQSDFRRIFERKMRERQQFVEAFYGQVPGYEVAIDFGRKRGPLSAIDEALRREQQKIENGGSGAPGERMIVPGGTPSSAPRQGEPPGGEGAQNPEGSGEAPAPSPETRPADERVRVSPGDEEPQN
ncbi:MAG TPA: type II secretion system secretin GspD [Myxococcaceae bacterium]|nr:type II secretion system secretin GspD [Myxococcaceae bacterium]